MQNLPSATRRRLIYTAILGVVVIGLLLMRAFQPKPVTVEPPDARPFVEASAYQRSEGLITIEGFGVLRGEFDTALATEVSGRVQQIHPKLRAGAIVQRGDLLLELDARQFESQVAELVAEQRARRAEQQQLRVQLNRLQNLTDREFVSADQIDELRARVEAAEAAVQRAEASLQNAKLNLERSALKAPFTAVVESLSVGLGDVVQPGQVVARLSSLEALEVPVPLTNSEVRLLDGHPGDAPAEIILRNGERYSGRVVRLAHNVDRGNRTVNAVVGLSLEDSETPRIGEFVRAELKAQYPHPHYQLPRAALREADAIWILEDGRLQRRSVTVLLLSGDSAFVSGELGDSGKAVTLHPPVMTDGMNVRLRERRNQAAP